VIPLCERHGISQIVWSPHAQGVLTGKYLPGEKVPADSRAANKAMNRFIRQWLKDDTLTAVQSLRPIADDAGLTLSQLALAWVLHRPNITAVITGATRPEQVRENVKAADATLSDEAMAAIDAALKTAAVY
jgi:aryl-alcohol dehydrogenase-like predicted oxidoreductase